MKRRNEHDQQREQQRERQRGQLGLRVLGVAVGDVGHENPENRKHRNEQCCRQVGPRDRPDWVSHVVAAEHVDTERKDAEQHGRRNRECHQCHHVDQVDLIVAFTAEPVLV